MTFSSRSSEVLAIPFPPRFDFWRTVYSHGWCALPPFSVDPVARTLTRVHAAGDGTTARWTLRRNGRSISAEVEPGGTGVPPPGVMAEIRTCLRLDEDFSSFHRMARSYPRYRWIAACGAGRLLRAPTMFEDTVKMICTTNCTWGLTTLMVGNLVRSTGRRHDDEHHAFPTPDAIAALSEAYLRKEIKAGYRSPFILLLATQVAAGYLDIESWRTSPLPTDELFREMRNVKGIGPYAAGNLLKLAGRYDELGLDSWVRSKYFELRRGGRKVKDVTIERDYASYGEWRGLFLWLEMTRNWHQDKFRL